MPPLAPTLAEADFLNSSAKPDEYFFILKDIRMLEAIPSKGKIYEYSWDFLEPVVEATAAPARLPRDVFWRIIGKQPITVGRRKSSRNPTFVAAKP